MFLDADKHVNRKWVPVYLAIYHVIWLSDSIKCSSPPAERSRFSDSNDDFLLPQAHRVTECKKKSDNFTQQTKVSIAMKADFFLVSRLTIPLISTREFMKHVE